MTSGKSASRPGELVLELAMHVPALLVLLHGPKKQRLSAARFFPSFPDVLLLLLVLDQMLAFALAQQDTPVVKFGEGIWVKRAGGQCEKSGSCRAGSTSFWRVSMLLVSASIVYPSFSNGRVGEEATNSLLQNFRASLPLSSHYRARLASSQEMEACGLASGSRKRFSSRAFSASVSAPPSSHLSWVGLWRG